MSKRKNKPSFEQSLDELKSIVQQLEDGSLSLSESLEKYESGIGHLQLCYEALEQAERKIRQLVKLDADGKPITKPFDDQATHSETDAMAKGNKGTNRYPHQQNTVTQQEGQMSSGRSQSLFDQAESSPRHQQHRSVIGLDDTDSDDDFDDGFDDDDPQNEYFVTPKN